jgi:hypothetical protein
MSSSRSSRRRARITVVVAASAVALLGLPALLGTPSAAARGVDPSGSKGVTFVVETAENNEPISPLIYGINADKHNFPGFDALLTAVRPGLIRLGGDRWTAYNWENNDSNAGSDYEYENDDFLSSSTKPGAAILPTVQAATARGIPVLVTIPIAGYVSADRSPPGPVQNSGPNYLQTRFKIDEPTDPDPLSTTPDKTDDYVYQNQFVYWLQHAAPTAQIMFSLDNEPDLWDSTHAEIHPSATTYAELWSKDLEYATAVKGVWPSAPVTGPVSYGWEGYETLQNAPDSAKDGNFLDWWLHQVHVADAAAGYDVINDLDLHWYPEATDPSGTRITGTDTTPAEVVAREQAPRSLWDKSYVEDSWITEDSLNGKGIDLIPRLDGQIAAHNSGMNLDFTEWNYGGGQDISGGIATADVLGIFGRYGVHAAAMWPLNANESYTYGAFEMYRNYDGKGGSFGDTEVKATTTNEVETSVYASIDESDPDHVVLVAINKSLAPMTATIDLDSSASFGAAKTYTLTSAAATPEPGAGLEPIGSDVYTYTMPAQSVSVIVPAVQSTPRAADSAPSVVAATGRPGSGPAPLSSALPAPLSSALRALLSSALPASKLSATRRVPRGTAVATTSRPSL